MSLKWSILAALGGLVLAVIFTQQDVGWLALVLALASGWFACQSYALWRGRNKRATRKRNGPPPPSMGFVDNEPPSSNR
jgi:hypothetical protein